MKNTLRLFLCTLAIFSSSANSAIISLVQNTGYPESYTHGAGAYVVEQWLDIDATCTGYDIDYAVFGSVSASAGHCTSGTANSTFNFTSNSTSLLADGTVSVSVEDTSSIANTSARAGSIVDINFSVDITSYYEIAALFVDGGQNGEVGFDSRIQILEDGVLIEDISNSPTGSVILQGTFQYGKTYQLISGVAAYGDTDYFLGSTGNGSGNFSTSLTLVPIPASVWLFGTGLISLIGLAKRKVRI